MNLLIYVYSIQIPSHFLWVADHICDDTSSYYRRPKKFSLLLPSESFFTRSISGNKTFFCLILELITTSDLSKYGLSLIRIFPLYEQNRIFPYLERIEDFVQIPQKTNTTLSIYGKIRTKESPYCGIFHAVDNYKRKLLKEGKAVENDV